jgi:hypothetical protein
MPVFNCYAGTVKFRAKGIEAADLPLRLIALEVGGRCEVAHEAFEPAVAGISNCFKNLLSTGTGPEPAHPAIHFQVIHEQLAAGCGQTIVFADIVNRMQDGRQAMLDCCLPAKREKIRHYEDARLSARFTESNTFLHIADSEPARTCRL